MHLRMYVSVQQNVGWLASLEAPWALGGPESQRISSLLTAAALTNRANTQSKPRPTNLFRCYANHPIFYFFSNFPAAKACPSLCLGIRQPASTRTYPCTKIRLRSCQMHISAQRDLSPSLLKHGPGIHTSYSISHNVCSC